MLFTVAGEPFRPYAYSDDQYIEGAAEEWEGDCLELEKGSESTREEKRKYVNGETRRTGI
jgi:hypothetical protein